MLAAVFVILASVVAYNPASGSAAVRVSTTGLNNPLFEGILYARQRTSYPTPNISSSDEGYLAICLAVKDQAEDVREWALHHLNLGVSKIYILEHNSTRPALPEIQDLVHAGGVEYEFVKSWDHGTGFFQLWAFDACIRRHRYRHRWMAFIDVDEFLMLRDPNVASLPALLSEYEDQVGIGVNWQVYGSSGRVQRPPQGTLRGYSTCLPREHPENRNLKTIANLAHVDCNGGSSHMFQFLGGRYPVNTARQTVGGTLSRHIVWDRLVLAHYVLKSREEYEAKMARGGGRGIRRKWDYFDRIDAAATETCMRHSA